jgi:RNA polymerase sigma factor (sigma-70 family)
MEINEKTYRKIYGYVCRKLNQDLRARYLEDCVQYVCMKHIETGRSWGYLVIDFLRSEGVTKCRRSHQTPTTQALEYVEENHAPQCTDRVDELLSSLPKKFRDVLELIYLKEYTLKEVAEIIGVSTFTIHKIRARALKKLRRDLEQR